MSDVSLDRIGSGWMQSHWLIRQHGDFWDFGSCRIRVSSFFLVCVFAALLMLRQDGLRPVIYYLEHLVRDTDETKTFSRALISFVKYNNPKTIMHPILVFVLEVLWTHLAPWHEAHTQSPYSGSGAVG